jgi:hypothetical protein
MRRALPFSLIKKEAKNQRLKINCLKTTLRYAEPCKLVLRTQTAQASTLHYVCFITTFNLKPVIVRFADMGYM